MELQSDSYKTTPYKHTSLKPIYSKELVSTNDGHTLIGTNENGAILCWDLPNGDFPKLQLLGTGDSRGKILIWQSDDGTLDIIGNKVRGT